MFSPLYSSHTNHACEIKLVRNVSDINQDASKSILVESFIGEYQKYLKPQEIDSKLNSWRDGEKSVQNYYEMYFKEELEEYTHKKIDFWVEAYVGNKLAGWATFLHENDVSNSVYMNLLVVDPKYQCHGVGRQLVNSLITLKELPELESINLLLRKKNQGGRAFYTKLGFTANAKYQRPGNFVDLDLLEGFTWKKPILEIANLKGMTPKANIK